MADDLKVGKGQDHKLVGNKDCNETQHDREVVQVQDCQVKGWALSCENYAAEDKIEHRKREGGRDDG